MKFFIAVTPKGCNSAEGRERVAQTMRDQGYTHMEWRNVDGEQAELYGKHKDDTEEVRMSNQQVSTLASLIL